MKFGKRLTFCRSINSLSQTQAAKLIGISQASLSSYEHDQKIPGSMAVYNMADVYGVSTDFLLSRTDESKWHDGYIKTT